MSGEDITMCTNEKCSYKMRCCRYIAIPERFQSYADFDEREKEPCGWFLVADAQDRAEYMAYLFKIAKERG